jgi:hypothetical protein
VAHIGGPVLFTLAMFAKSLMGAAAGTLLEAPGDFLKGALEAPPSPIAIKMEVIVQSSTSLEFKWRGCRQPEIEADWDRMQVLDLCKGDKCPGGSKRGQAGAKAKYTKAQFGAQCLKLRRPFPAIADIHLVSMNRLELTFPIPLPFPGSMAKIMPVFGLEIDIDITPIFTLVLNYKRKNVNEQRQKKCMTCWIKANKELKQEVGGVAFCDRRYLARHWTWKLDDREHGCMFYKDDKEKEEKQKKCQNPIIPKNHLAQKHNVSDLIDLSAKCHFVQAENLCKSITFPRVNQDKPPRHLLKPMKRSGAGGNVGVNIPDQDKGDSLIEKSMLLDMGEKYGEDRHVRVFRG